MAINKELTMKAYQTAIGQIKKLEFEDEKLLFDPKSEQKKRKRYIKEKLFIILLRCSRMHLKANEVTNYYAVSVEMFDFKI